MTIKVLINLFAALIEVIIIKELYDTFGKKNGKYRYIFYPVLLLYLGFSVVATLYIKMPIVLLAINAALCMIISFGYQITKVKTAISLLIHIVMGVTLEIIVVLIISGINGISAEQFGQNNYLYLQGVLIVKLASYFIVRSIRSASKSYHKVIDSKASGLFLLIPLATMAVLFILSTFVYQINDRIAINAVVVVSLLLIAANIATFYIYDYIIKQTLDKKNAEQRSLMQEQEIKNYAEIINISSIANKKNHDLKHKLYQVREYVNDNNILGSSLIDELCTTIDEVQIIKYFGINAVDALINVKRQEMKSEDIAVNIESFVAGGINIDSIDMCVIVGNLLSNASESCNKIINREKSISLRIAQQGGYLILNMENSALPDEVKIGKTSKENKHEHGFGLVNIKEIAEKYNGQLSVRYNDGTFTTVVTLKNT